MSVKAVPVIDDDKRTRENLRLFLELDGFVVDCSESGPSAHERRSYWVRKKVSSMRTTMECIFCDSVFPCYAGWYEHIMEHLRSEAEMTIKGLLEPCA